MPRRLLALVGLLLVGGCAVSSLVAFDATIPSSPTECGEYSEHPHEGWVRLEGCVLDFDSAVLTDGQGVLERLEARKRGVWSALPDGPITWRGVYVPVKTPETRARPARLVILLGEPDLLAWFNALEAAPDPNTTQLVRRGRVIDRYAIPGTLVVESARGLESELVQKALGRDGAPGLWLLHSGHPPERTVPFASIVGGLVGFGLLFWSSRKTRPLGDASADTVDVRGVEVELGALERLRQEERDARKK